MDSAHRHELEQNVLAEKLVTISDRIRPYLSRMLISLVALGVVWAGYQWWLGRVAEAKRDSWIEFAAADSPEKLALVQSRFPGSEAARYAKLRIADYTAHQGKLALFDNREKALKDLNAAVDLYDQVSKLASDNADLRRQALLGKAIALESTGAPKKATEVYQILQKQYPNSMEARGFADVRLKRLSKDWVETFYLDLVKTDKPPAPPKTASPGPDFNLDFLKDLPPPPPSKAGTILPPLDDKPGDGKAKATPPPAPPVPVNEPSPTDTGKPKTPDAKSVPAKTATKQSAK